MILENRDFYNCFALLPMCTFVGGILKAVLLIIGDEVFRHLKYESGVHRVQRIPRTEQKGRVHTSTITVAVLPKPREVN